VLIARTDVGADSGIPSFAAVAVRLAVSGDGAGPDGAGVTTGGGVTP
jgi:hypothetical protein